MDNTIVNLNKEYLIKEVTKKLEIFANEIIKKNDEIIQLKDSIRRIEKNRASLANAYAKKLGIILTKKQWEKSTVKGHKK
jgi:hypothetical protein